MTSLSLPQKTRLGPNSTLSCQRVGGCTAGATITALSVVALLVSACLLCVWSRTEAVQLGYSLSETAQNINTLNTEQQQLRAEAASLRSPERIESLARQKLGMQYPGPEQIRVMEIQSTEKKKAYALARRAELKGGGKLSD